MKPQVLAQTLHSIAHKIERSASPSRESVLSDLRLTLQSLRLSAKADEILEEEFRAAYDVTPQESLMESLGDDYPITVDNLWKEFFELSNSEADKKRSKKILKALGL